MKAIATISLLAGAVSALGLGGLMLMASEADEAPDELAGSAWTLIAWSDESGLPDRPITLEFVEDRISGSTSCNRYSSPLELENRSFQIGEVATTMMFCIDTAEAETIYLNLLSQVDSYERVGDNLILSDGFSERLRFEAS